MPHTRAEVIKRVRREFTQLDRLVAHLKPQEWRLRVPRPETKDPWTIKDALAHITYWKYGVVLSARGERRPSEAGLNITEGNRVIYLRWKRKSPKEVLGWHRQVQKDLLKALREAPTTWFTRRSRQKNWPFDADGHSAAHRIHDIEGALAKRSRKRTT